MDLREHLVQAWESITDHTMRVVASSMSVSWGTASIILLLSWSTGFREFMGDEVSRYGRGNVQVMAGSTSSGFPGVRSGVPIRFDREDLAVTEASHGELIEALLPVQRPSGRTGDTRVLVEAGSRVQRLDLSASDPRWFEYRNFRLSAGRPYDASDLESRARVAVLGHDAATDLFGEAGSALGARIRIEGQPFEVIGVAARKGRQVIDPGRPDDRMVLVPLTTAQTRLGMGDELRHFLLFPRPGVDSSEALRAALTTLGARVGFHPDDLDAMRRNDTSRLLHGLDLAYTGFLVFIGLAGTVTLLVGGIGIANLQLVILAERTAEIGLAKALGARSGTLALQAMLEACLVSGTAALLGALVGLAGCFALRELAPPGLFPVPIVSPSSVGITAGALVAVAVVAALVPARRVRGMDVSVALRAAS
jgi:putative ABC transport system permease protein